MTDQAAAEDPATDEEPEEGAGDPTPTGKMPGKKLILFIVLPIFLVVAGGSGAYFTGLLNPLLGISEEEVTEELVEAPSGPSVYFEIPEMLVNLNSTGRKTGYLKISISLELGSEEDVALLEGVMPRVVDGFQVYLRELRVEDLQGSAGLQRLREELLLRVASAARPAQIKDVLFREMLIQ
jgi:flagellar protein FliL